MMKRHLSASLFAAGLLAHSVAPAAQYYGTELPFTLGADARTSGMGVAGASLLGIASLQSHNPSTLSYLESKQFTFFRTMLFDSRSAYHAMSYAHPLLNHGTVGISVLRVGVGGIEERDDTNQLLADDLKNSQTRVLLGYARHITSGLAAGLNLKIDNQSFAGFNGAGIGLDVGLVTSQTSRHKFLKGFRQALVVQNIVEPVVKLDVERVSDPRSLTLGAAAVSAAGNVVMVTAIDVVRPRYSPLALHVGHEVLYRERYALRIGLDDTSPTYGFGAKYRDLSFDYAYRTEDVGGNHRISLSVSFGQSRAERETNATLQHEGEISAGFDPQTIGRETLPNERQVAGPSSEEVERLMQVGIELYNDARFDSALSCFEEVMRIDRGNILAKAYRDNCQISILGFVHRHVLDARVQTRTGDYEAAIRTMESALELEPDNQILIRELQQCREMQRLSLAGDGQELDRVSESEDGLRTKGSSARESMQTAYRHGVVSFNKGDFVEATEHFLTVWKLDPEFHNVSSLLSHAYLFAGMKHYSERNYVEATRIWKQILIVDPENNTAAHYLGLVRKAVKKPRDR